VADITTEYEFAQQNRASPLPLSRVCRLSLNGEHLGFGRWAKRRGISTSVTVNMQIGSEAPFWFLNWKIGNNYYLVAVGNDVGVIHSPQSNYLYVSGPDYANGLIYSGPSVALDTFGLNAPTVAGYMETETKYVDEPYSLFAGGVYAAKVCSYEPVRRCKSPGTDILAEYGDHQDQLGAYVSGPVQYLKMPAAVIDSKATLAHWYRARMLTGLSGNWTMGKGEGQLRFVNSNNGSAWSDYGGEFFSDFSEMYDFATDPIPPCDRGIWYHGRGFWLQAGKTGCHHYLYWSNPLCPETTGLNDYSVAYDDGRAVQVGKFYLAVPVHCGVPTALVARGEVLLVLCEFGSWRVLRHPSMEGVYVLEQDNLWVGCVSAATISHGPEGVYWVSHQGIVLWDGVNAPRVVTETVLDPTDSDTLFASDLSACSGAYDQDRRNYVCVIAKSGGGQFGLCLHGEPLERNPNDVQYSTWTFGDNLATITGMGYDWYNRRLVYAFGAETVTAKTQVDDVYRDNHATEGDTYPYGPEVWSGELPRRLAEEDKHSLGCRIFLHRDNLDVEQTLSVYMDALRTTEEPAFGDPESLVWAADEMEPKYCCREGDFGRLLRVKITETSAYPLEIRAVQIGTESDIQAAHGVT